MSAGSVRRASTVFLLFAPAAPAKLVEAEEAMGLVERKAMVVAVAMVAAVAMVVVEAARGVETSLKSRAGRRRRSCPDPPRR